MTYKYLIANKNDIYIIYIEQHKDVITKAVFVRYNYSLLSSYWSLNANITVSKQYS